MSWQFFGWVWFVFGCVVISVFFLAGNSPMRPGPASTFVFPVVTFVVAASMGSWVVCWAIGRGRTYFGRPGGGNVAWLLVAVPVWAACMALTLSL